MDANKRRYTKNTATFGVWVTCVLLTGCFSLDVRGMSDVTGPTPTIATIFQKQTPVPVDTSGDLSDAFVGVAWGDRQLAMPDSEAPVRESSADNIAMDGTDEAVQISSPEEDMESYDINVYRSGSGAAGDVLDTAQSISPPEEAPPQDLSPGNADYQGLPSAETHTGDEAHTTPEQVANGASTPVVIQNNRLQHPDHNRSAHANGTRVAIDSFEGNISANSMRGTQMFPIPTGTPVSRYTSRLDKPRLVVSDAAMPTPAPVRLPTPLLDAQLLTQRPEFNVTPKPVATPISYANLFVWSPILP